jgi:hypothetical protein
MKTTSATSVIWINTVTATFVRNVTGCGNMWDAAQTWTDLYGECYLQVSWWRVPYSKDRIRPVRRRRHRSPSGILRNSHCCMYNEICKLHCL